MNDLQLPNGALKYILFQRTDLVYLHKSSFYKKIKNLLPFSIYNQIVSLESLFNKKSIKDKYKKEMLKEYNIIKEFLPKNCSTVLDIGCGIAGIDVFINNHYSSSNIQFFLLDKTYAERNVYYDFHKKAAFYNSLFVAKSVLVQNDIKEENVHLIEATENNDVNINQNIDLVISLISWGFHYPVSTYLTEIYEILDKNGKVILDIRRETNGLKTLKSKFQYIRIIYNAKKYQRILAIK